VCEDGLFIPGFVVHHAHGEKMERVKALCSHFVLPSDLEALPYT
jgi:hypothetical protein